MGWYTKNVHALVLDSSKNFSRNLKLNCVQWISWDGTIGGED